MVVVVMMLQVFFNIGLWSRCSGIKIGLFQWYHYFR